MKKLITLTMMGCMAIALTLGMTACKEEHTHVYDNACDTVCNVCEEERTVAGHDWKDATCEAPKTCDICGVTEGEKLDHVYVYSVDGATITYGCEKGCDEGKISATLVAPASPVYDGTAKAVTVSGTLEYGEITYSTEDGAAPVNAGEYTASITVGGKTASLTYQIAKAIPVVTAPVGKEGLVYNSLTMSLYTNKGSTTGGTMEYNVNDSFWSNSILLKIEAGEYKIAYRVVGDENYEDVAEQFITVTIAPCDISEVESTITLSQDSFVYSGEEASPTVTVDLVLTYHGSNGTFNRTIEEGKDYELSYTNNVDAGTATVTITGKGNYTGTLTKTFQITPKEVTEAQVTVGEYEKIYDGSAKEPPVSVIVDGKTLTKGVDFNVTYSNNVYVSADATATVTFKGNYSGEATTTFEIIQDPATGGFDGEWVGF